MSETLFEQLFKPLGKRAYVFKITDTKEVSGLNNRKVKTKPQPSDYIACIDGQTFLAEIKSCDQATFPFSNIRPNQLAHARMILAAGGAYFFFIYRPSARSWFKVPAQYILDHKAKHLKWDELIPFTFSIVDLH